LIQNGRKSRLMMVPTPEKTNTSCQHSGATSN